MSLNRTQVESWNPGTLTDIGNAWKAMASGVEGLFNRYKSAVADVNGGHWEGLAATAALNRAESDRRAAVLVADHLERVAQMALDGFHEVDPPLQRARNAITGAEGAGFTVSENLTVSYSGDVTPERETARAQWQVAIGNAASDAERADNQVRTLLNGARADLRVTFVAPAALGSDQARSDASQLLNDPSHLTPEQLQRLIEAGSLTPDQLVDLASGDMVNIPASQMEYINGLARALDGKSSKEIEDMLNRLPPDARKGVANALQLLSTTSVTANVRGDREVPTTGRADLLPHKMYESLTRDDLVTNGWETVGGWSYNTWNLNGVADNQAAARIADMSDTTFKHGTGLDAAVLDTAGKYLHAQNAADSDDLFFVDGRGEHEDAPLTDQMFHAVADDRAAVANAVSGQHGQTLMADVFNHEWSDNGKGISELFDISEQDAIADPGNRPDTALATQSGDIAESVARYMSDHHSDLLHLPGDPSTSAGERNPDLMINVADDLAPYYSTFAGSESIPNVGHFHTANELADMYSVLATNPDAGVKAAQATYAQENVLAAMYGKGEGPSTYAQVAGQMQHALENGTASAWKSLDQGDVYKANWDAAVNAATWDTSYKAAGAIINYLPGGSEMKALIDVAGPALKPSIVGIVDPSTVTDPGNAVPNQAATTMVDSNMTVENIANGLVSKDPSLVNDPAFAPYRDVNGDGDAYINVENLNDQAAIRDLLYSRYGINVDSWYTNYSLGMQTGTIAVTGPH
ncbi:MULTISPECIES: hypothetical protein [unclassified Mycobacterium]|uniref:TPR repeat region-containing protein n=1 Tax=unclassified Mycobacterium TaxID=2642494 RepID=UPI0029C73949|nr:MULTISPECIES: hypothetical protein [unclassified Mycobacterium]